MIKNVEWAVVPCAGKGTRFLPITKGVAKEMLPIIDRPTLDYIVEELINSGIKNIVFIVSRGKKEINKFYDRNEEFENDLILNGKDKYAELIKDISLKANFYYVIQEELLGLGHAVLQAKNVIKDNNFVVCCGDDICTYKNVPPTKQLIDCFINNETKCVVGGQKVAHENIVKYGCMDVLKQIDDKTYLLKDIIEKPELDKAPSDLASLGKWIFSSDIFKYLKKTPKGKGGEIQLTDAIALLMKDYPIYFYDFDGRRYDCGDKFGFFTAIVDFALERDDLKDKAREYIKNLEI